MELGLNISISSTVPTEDCYFTSSRVGGKRGIIKELSVSLQGPEDNTLLFESRFESGNLQKAVRVWVTGISQRDDDWNDWEVSSGIMLRSQECFCKRGKWWEMIVRTMKKNEIIVTHIFLQKKKKLSKLFSLLLKEISAHLKFALWTWNTLLDISPANMPFFKIDRIAVQGLQTQGALEVL